MSEVTRILYAISDGDSQAADRLLPLVYDELRVLATQKMAQEPPGHTLAPTALVHEAYLRLVDVDEARQWDNRRHFFAAAAEAMRRILVENARRKRRLKYGGGRQRVPLDLALSVADTPDDDVLAVDEALQGLEQVDPQNAALVKLHFFAGLSLQETAQALGIAERTAYRDWAYARAWLARFLGEQESSPEKK
jgi:RNA polymerase sigma factor (TIGR02999 family)